MTASTVSGTGGTVRESVRPENSWYLRHAATLARWPVIDEAWAHAWERREEEARAGAWAGRRA